MTNYGYQYKELHFDLRTLTKFIGDNFYDQMLSRCRLESFNASVWLLQVSGAIYENCTKDS